MKYERPVCHLYRSLLNAVQSAEKCAYLLTDTILQYASSANGYEADE